MLPRWTWQATSLSTQLVNIMVLFLNLLFRILDHCYFLPYLEMLSRQGTHDAVVWRILTVKKTQPLYPPFFRLATKKPPLASLAGATLLSCIPRPIFCENSSYTDPVSKLQHLFNSKMIQEDILK